MVISTQQATYSVGDADGTAEFLATDGVYVFWTSNAGAARGGFRAPVAGGGYLRMSDANMGA